MEKIKIANLKCERCAKSIQTTLEKKDFKNIKIDFQSNEISFEENRQQATKILSNLDYPKKTMSFISYFLGRIKK